MPPSRCLHLTPLRGAIDSALCSRGPRCQSSLGSAHYFSTSSTNSYPSPGPAKGVRTLRLKKKGPPQKAARPPEPGERKAFRKRIVLSNTNALPVKAIAPLSADAVSVDKSEVYTLSPDIIDRLRAVEAFKTKQGWSFFHTPAVLMTKESRALGKEMDGISGEHLNDQDAENASRKIAIKKSSRKVIVGEKGSGKSVLLLQAMSMAFLRGWVVINLPDGRELASSHTAFSPIHGTSPVQYAQPAYTSKLLKQILDANEKVLQKLFISEKPKFHLPIKEGMSLAGLLELGMNDQDRAWAVFQVFWRELTKTNSSINAAAGERPPVLLCLDNMSHVMTESQYKVLNDAGKLTSVHAHDLALVNHFAQHLSGAAQFPNGGMVLAATSASDGAKADAMCVGISIAETRQALTSGTPIPPEAISNYSKLQSLSPDKNPDPLALSNFHSPFVPIDERVLYTLDKADVIRLAGLNHADSTTLMKYWAKSGMYRGSVLPWNVDEARALSGGAIVGELEKKVVRYLQREPMVLEGETGGKKIRVH
ncbi:uncharacterized protein PV09_09115 [Verruconis gallopava]|uniref:Small ribosomal subunit protein mS29 n=1 Tax=Verruconis gallopava TaxID=253628 RepID=A0A0D1XAD9_9PEZI|nr:uncharacterized protein PV09_09115 [Verruconis gallopava]KIV99160.1 hypothetical protein PV09_09115 [Verruconis gallopava]